MILFDVIRVSTGRKQKYKTFNIFFSGKSDHISKKREDYNNISSFLKSQKLPTYAT